LKGFRAYREFSVTQPNCVWAADITYVWTAEGWLYLAVALDLYSRAVIGRAIGDRLTTELAAQALTMAYIMDVKVLFTTGYARNAVVDHNNNLDAGTHLPPGFLRLDANPSEAQIFETRIRLRGSEVWSAAQTALSMQWRISASLRSRPKLGARERSRCRR
jgi:Integrase core domain